MAILTFWSIFMWIWSISSVWWMSASDLSDLIQWIKSRSLGPPSLCWPYFLGSTSDVAWLDWRKHDCVEANIKQGWCQKHVSETSFASVSVAVTRETCKSTAKSMICFEALLTVWHPLYPLNHRISLTHWRSWNLIYECLHLRLHSRLHSRPFHQNSNSLRPVLSLFLVFLGFRDIRDCLETDMK
jgi:hypothetical protein